MQRHEFSFELDAPPEEVWQVFWYRGPDRPQPKDVKTRIEILHPGDEIGNGLVRHCYFPVPWWLGSKGVGQSWEWLTEVKPYESWRYDAVGKPLWSHATGWTSLAPIADGRTRATFVEQYEAFNPIMRVLLEKRVHEGLSRDNDTILAALNGGLAWHRRRKAKAEAAAQAPPEDPGGAIPETGPARADQTRMSFSGIAAVQAQIQAIEQQVGAAPSPSTGATAGSGATNGADFASLLTDAMNTQSALSADSIGGSSDSSSLGAPSSDAGSGGLSSLLSEASALTGSNSSGALDTTSANSSALTSLVSSLGGSSSSTSPDLMSLLSQLTGSAGATGTTTTPDLSSLLAVLGTSGTTATPTIGTTGVGTPNLTTQNFLDAALSQQGKPYVWGATVSASDPSPAAFDCSELTKWAAARAGVTIPDGAADQYVWLKQQGDTMTVQQALQTPGALLFHFDSEPQPGLSGEPPVADVAISLGNGLTMEAKGHAYGVGVFQAGDRFNYAGMIPGMS